MFTHQSFIDDVKTLREALESMSEEEQRAFVERVPYMPSSDSVFFSQNPLAPNYYNAKIIPKRGVWLEIETDKKGIITVKIDRKRKIPATQY